MLFRSRTPRTCSTHAAECFLPRCFAVVEDMAVVHVVVDQTHRLHERIHGGRSDEPPSTLLQVLRQRDGGRCVSIALRFIASLILSINRALASLLADIVVISFLSTNSPTSEDLPRSSSERMREAGGMSSFKACWVS